jgi:hypothetical protein
MPIVIIGYNKADLISIFIVYTRYSPLNVSFIKRQFGLSGHMLYDQTVNNFLKLRRRTIIGLNRDVLLHVFIDGYLPAEAIDKLSTLLY